MFVIVGKPWSGRQMEVTEALVRRLVEDQFPHWSGLDVRAVLPGGWDNHTFRLGSEMSVRLPSAARYAGQPEKEHHWLAQLGPHLPQPIPEPLGLGRPSAHYPFPWSVRGWLPGTPLSESRLLDAVPLARSLASFLTALRTIDASEGPSPGTQNFHRGGRLDTYGSEFEASLRMLDGAIDTHRARAIWTQACRSTWREEPVWVHGDIAPGNLLIGNGDLVGVLDFGCLAVGDPACDLAMAWTYFDADGRRAFRAASGLDDETWQRAAGWALWKAAIVASGRDPNQREAAHAWRVLERLAGDVDDLLRA